MQEDMETSSRQSSKSPEPEETNSEMDLEVVKILYKSHHLL